MYCMCVQGFVFSRVDVLHVGIVCYRWSESMGYVQRTRGAQAANSLLLDSDRLRLALLAKARKSKARRCRSGGAMEDTMPTRPTYGTYGERLTYTDWPSCTATPCA